MSRREAEIIEQLRHLSLHGAKELIAGVDRLRELYETGDHGGGDHKRSSGGERGGWSDLAFRFARAELEHAEALLDVSHRQTELLFGHARELISKSRKKGEPKRVLDLKHRFDEAAYVGKFSIENPLDAKAFARFVPTEFHSASGEPRKFDGLIIRTKNSSVRARGKATVMVQIPAKVVQAQPPGAYFAELEVYLSADVEVRVADRILRLRRNV